jgi:pantoate--beta-alanine ligase
VADEVAAVATSIDYVSVAQADTLAPVGDDLELAGRAVVALAVRIGKTRLIDNLVLGEDLDPSRRIS